jgi:hypothetical protein
MHVDYAGDVIQFSLLLYNVLHDRRVVVCFAVVRDVMFTRSGLVRGPTQRGKREGLFFPEVEVARA